MKALKTMEQEFYSTMQQQEKELDGFKLQWQSGLKSKDGRGKSSYSKLMPSKIENFAGLPGENIMEWFEHWSTKSASIGNCN